MLDLYHKLQNHRSFNVVNTVHDLSLIILFFLIKIEMVATHYTSIGRTDPDPKSGCDQQIVFSLTFLLNQ